MKKIILRNIEAERVRHGLSKEALAEQLGVTSKTYLSWIRGITEIPSTKLLEFSRRWNVTIEYLLTQEGENPTRERNAG